jgi:hypothetical protein
MFIFLLVKECCLSGIKPIFLSLPTSGMLQWKKPDSGFLKILIKLFRADI